MTRDEVMRRRVTRREDLEGCTIARATAIDGAVTTREVFVFEGGRFAVLRGTHLGVSYTSDVRPDELAACGVITAEEAEAIYAAEEEQRRLDREKAEARNYAAMKARAEAKR